MNPSRPFILRPIATSLLMAALLLIGIIGYRQLPIAALPEVDYPTMQVMTFYPGASADVVATGITAPLERQLGEVPGLSRCCPPVPTAPRSSRCNSISASTSTWPRRTSRRPSMPRRPTCPPTCHAAGVQQGQPGRCTHPHTGADLRFAAAEPGEDFADTRLAAKISQLPGVGAVTISGGQKPAVRVQSQSDAAGSSYGLNLDDVRTALVARRVSTPRRVVSTDRRRSYQIGANDQITSQRRIIRKLVLAYQKRRAGHADRRREGRRRRSRTTSQSAWMNKVPAVILNIQRQPGANIIDVVDTASRRLLPKLKATIPQPSSRFRCSRIGPRPCGRRSPTSNSS